MHGNLFDHIKGSIANANAFVLRHMPLNLTHDEIYEDLVGDPEIAQAFANAAQYLPPSSLSKHMVIETEEWGMLTLSVKLQPTEKYPAFLFPKQSLFLTRESKLSRALQLSMRVEQEWQMLFYAFNKMQDYVDPSIVAFLFPWIRELIAEWREQNPIMAFIKSKQRVAIDREVNAILSDRAPRNFPRLTEELNAVCRSGKALFSQYRMLESTHSNAPPSPVLVTSSYSRPVSLWLIEHVGDVLADWCKEREERAECERIGRDFIIKKQRQR